MRILELWYHVLSPLHHVHLLLFRVLLSMNHVHYYCFNWFYCIDIIFTRYNYHVHLLLFCVLLRLYYVLLLSYCAFLQTACAKRRVQLVWTVPSFAAASSKASDSSTAAAAAHTSTVSSSAPHKSSPVPLVLSLISTSRNALPHRARAANAMSHAMKLSPRQRQPLRSGWRHRRRQPQQRWRQPQPRWRRLQPRWRHQ